MLDARAAVTGVCPLILALQLNLGSHRDKTWPDGWCAQPACWAAPVVRCMNACCSCSCLARFSPRLRAGKTDAASRLSFPRCRTAVTEDGRRSAQFEHTLVITEGGCEILTARLPTSPPMFWEVDSS